MAIVPDTDLLERHVRAYVAAGSGIAGAEVIPGNDPGPSPTELYATVLLIDEGRDGTTWERPRRTGELVTLDGIPTGNVDVYESNRLRYSVQWYAAARPQARDAGRRFKLWAGTSLGRYEASRRGLTFLGLGEIRRLDWIEDAEYEDRVGLELTLGIVSTLREDVGYVESADIELCPDEPAIPLIRIDVDAPR